MDRPLGAVRIDHHHAVFFDPPGQETSNAQAEMTPLFPACSSRIDMSDPIMLTSRMTSGSMSGSSGSAYGGTNIRGPLVPIWCSSRKTCGNQSW